MWTGLRKGARSVWKDGLAEMAISRAEVLHVAQLARLALREDEVERLTRELGAILDAVSKVSELDLADVPPTSHPLDVVNVWAEDEPHEPLSLDETFANAPAREDDQFRVPPTVTPMEA
jgi:aspartyl-tRNA(Asn)/glutamyl-tRNA(Gln) amidotransferase subunit C